LFQLHTEHMPLNIHVHHITKVPSPTYQQCHCHEETVHYFLLACPKYARQCLTLQNKIGPQANHCKNLPNNSKYTKPLLCFIVSTHRLEQIFRDVTPPMNEEEEE
ncbi:hypothetical protein BDR06DRAFT_891967, partial [Suillus hirtellus]